MQPNQILGDRYQLKQALGQVLGRQTWLAVDLSLQPTKPVVVKLLAFSELMQWDDLKLFEREAQVLQHLDHPHIPRYLDSFTVGEAPCWFGLVQSYIPGTSLKQLLEQGKHFPEKQVRQIAANILHLLKYLHELSPPVLHRDIKPSNLIWGEDNFIYLIDFGAVQDRAARQGATFTVVGTYGYTPMEQFGGRAVPASDLYGLGATLVHLLTGISPADLPQKDLRIQFRDRVSLNLSFVTWIEKLVEPDVMQRFQSAQEALDALRAQAQLPAQRSNVSLPQPRLAPPDKTRISIQKSPQQLLIKLPGTSLCQLLLLIPIGLILSSLSAFVSYLAYVFSTLGVLVPVGLLLGAIAVHLYSNFLPTFVQFEDNKFFIYKSFFKLQVTLDHGFIANIEDVFHTCKTFQSITGEQQRRVIVIQSNPGGEAYLGAGLSWEECSWVVAMITDWLNR